MFWKFASVHKRYIYLIDFFFFFLHIVELNLVLLCEAEFSASLLHSSAKSFFYSGFWWKPQ